MEWRVIKPAICFFVLFETNKIELKNVKKGGNMWKLFSMLFILTAGLSVVPSNVVAAAEGTSEQMLFMEIPSIITASKKQEKIQEAPAVVTVITAEEIKDFGCDTLYDVLQRLTSVQMAGSHMLPDNISVIRGDLETHYDNHVLILINGRPFRDSISGGQNGPLYQIFPVDVIDHIEFVRGPGSVLYGSDAFQGVINIITKKPAEGFSAELTAGGGSFGAGRAKLLWDIIRATLVSLLTATILKITAGILTPKHFSRRSPLHSNIKRLHEILQ